METRINLTNGQYTVSYLVKGQVVAVSRDGVLSVAERGAIRQLKEQGYYHKYVDDILKQV